MSIRPEIFGAKRVSIKTEDLDFYPQSNAKIKTNGKRVLNEDDLLGLISGLDPVGNAPNDYAASISAGKLQLQPCDRDDPGVLVEGAQNLPDGDKTLVGTFTSTNLSGTNTGDVTLTTIGATPNANGLSLTGQQLRAQPANGSFGGVVTTSAQSFAGEKTMNDGVVSLKRYRGPMTADSTTGVIEFETAGSPGKRVKIHHYSAFPNYANNYFWGGGDGTPETQAGNFTMTGVDNLGVGDGALFRATTAEGNIVFFTGNQLTTGFSNFLVRGGQQITVGDNMYIIGQNAWDTSNCAGAGEQRFCLIWGPRACQYTTNADDCVNSIVIGPNAAQHLQRMTDSIFMSGRERTIPQLVDFTLDNSTMLNCDIRNVTQIEDAIGIQSDCREFETIGSNPLKTYINYPGTPLSEGVVKMGGIFQTRYDDSHTVPAVPTDLKIMAIDNTDRITSLYFPGQFGRYTQAISNFSFVNKSLGNVLPFSGSITANPYLHTSGNSFIIDIHGSFKFTLRYQSGTDDANVIVFLRKNAANHISEQRFIGKSVAGIENPPVWIFEATFDPLDVIEFTVAGNSDAGGGGNIIATGVHSISVWFNRRNNDYPSLEV
jgi:hypothetical protein